MCLDQTKAFLERLYSLSKVEIIIFYLMLQNTFELVIILILLCAKTFDFYNFFQREIFIYYASNVNVKVQNHINIVLWKIRWLSKVNLSKLKQKCLEGKTNKTQ